MEHSEAALENSGEKELASEIGEYDMRERTWKGGNQEREIEGMKIQQLTPPIDRLSMQWTHSCEYNHNRLS